MRLLLRGRAPVKWNGQVERAALRPLSGALQARRYGEYVQDMIRLLLPWNARIAPGDRVEINGAPYICAAVRLLSGHVQADVRRCAP